MTHRWLLLTLVLVCVTPVAVGLVTYRTLQPAWVDRVTEQLKLESQDRGQQLERAITQAQRTLRALSRGATVQRLIERGSLDARGRDLLVVELEAILQSHPTLLDARLLDPTGAAVDLVRVRRTQPGAEVEVADTPAATSGHAAYGPALQALASGELLTTPLTLDTTSFATPVPVLSVATPVDAATGVRIGSLVLTVDATGALARVRAPAMPDWFTYAVDQDGDLIAHPDRALEFGTERGTPHQLSDVAPAVAAAIASPDPIHRVIDERGVEWVLGTYATSIVGGSRIVVVTQARADAIAASFASVRRVAAGTSLITILVALGAALVTGRVLTRPLDRLIEAVHDLRRTGQWTYTDTPPGEVGALANALAQLHLDLRTRATALAEEVGRREAAEARTRRLGDVVRSTDDAVITQDLDGTITSWNAGAVALYGVPAEAAVGRRVQDAVHLDPETAAEIQDAIRDGQHLDTIETVHVDANGRRIDVSVRVSPLRTQEGVLEGASHIVRDITGRVRSESQVRQSQRLEAIGRLAGGVAHDFNNMLTAIGGFTELLDVELDPRSPARRHVAEIRMTSKRAAGLTRQLLAFARRQVLEPRQIDLNDAIARLRELLQRVIGDDVTLTIDLAVKLHRVRIDPTQVDQVLVNLAANARDAMPDGGHLTIQTRNVQVDEAFAAQHADVDPGPHVAIIVSDDGVGMDRTTLSQIFEPFFTTKDERHGTGLGLATVHGIVRQSGGAIWAYSEPGGGTTFKIYLPGLPPDDDLVEDTTSSSHRLPTVSVHGEETVLFVEDQDYVRRAGSAILEHFGYHVITAEDGAQALEIAAAFPGRIHLLLTDVVMPGMSGRELARRLAIVRPDTRALYTSGYTDDAVVKHGLVDAGLHFIQKPYSAAALAQKVREVLDAEG